MIMARLFWALSLLAFPAVFFSAVSWTASSAQAQQQQEALPALPAPIQNLVNEGAQIRFLGRDHGLESWLTIKNGQEQYFYVLPGGDAFVMGMLFDKAGKLLTVEQVRRLRAQGDDMLDRLAEDFPASEIDSRETQAFEFQSPSERLYHDVENSNWVPVGAPGAPVLYSFIDPQCPHCHAFMNDLRQGFLENGRIQVRMIPVGFREETRAQAAFLIATPNPQERWLRHMDGDPDALPARSEINQQGVQRNLGIMQSWKFDATPMSVYRAKDGTVKIVRGRPKDIQALIADLGARS